MTAALEPLDPIVDPAVTRPGAHLHAAYRTEARELVVESVTAVAEAVRHVVLAAPGGVPLASFEPGSHVVVDTPLGRNAYSLTGDGCAPSRYTISVLRHGAGGGSDWIHDVLGAGDRLVVDGPRSMFAPRHHQRHALLVAGGIGITPILSHARSLARWGGSGEILYAYRAGRAAHLDEVRALAELGFTLREVSGAEQVRAALADRFADQPLGTHAYACGPITMLDAFLEIGRDAGWPDARLHVERFETADLDPGVDFEITPVTTGRPLTVRSGVSVLQTLLDDGFDVPSMCRQGVCGECRIPVRRAGSLEHRDVVLTDQEKATGGSMLSCVSRGTDVEVDL
ncbi:MAG: PDR/VanB family oxidoreductase [Aeromicrobium sp.]